MRHIRMANNKDKAAILNLYHSLIGTPGCTWSMEYPTMFEIENDIASCSLYCMFDESDNIIAVASAGKSDELNHLLWNEKIRNPCDLARVGVKRSMHHQGLGYSIVEFMITDLKKRGFDGIRMLVSRTNPSALALYEKLNFCRCGETRM